MKVPDFNLEEIEKSTKQNSKERLEFAKFYAEWVKKTPNKVWSSQQKKLIDKAER